MSKRSYLAMVLVLASLISMVCLMSGAVWAVPALINYQGKLTNPSDCVLSGTYQIIFRLYAGGIPKWEEEQAVTVDQGIFNVNLGSVVSFPAGLFESDDLNLEMVIWNPDQGDGVWETLSPQQKLTSVAYAIKANHAATAGDADTVDGKHAPDLIAPETDPTVPANLKDGVSWSEVANIPADIADGDQVGITTEQDPTVPASVKDGVEWSEVSGIPAGFADGVDDTGSGDGHSLDAADGDPQDALYVDSNGTVGIGTINPVPEGRRSWKLNVNGKASIGDCSSGVSYNPIHQECNYTLMLNADEYTSIGFHDGGQAIGNIKFSHIYGFEIGQIDGLGNNNPWGPYNTIMYGRVGIGNPSPSYKLQVAGDAMADHWYTSSDSRLKENITPLTDAIDKISALRGIYFNFKGEPPSNREVGVIAQEVEAVLPEVVSEDAEGYKSVDYSRLTPLLIEAIKELKAENEALKAGNGTLKQDIGQIKRALGL